MAVSGSQTAPVVLTFKADQSISYDIRFEISASGTRVDCLLGTSVYSCGADRPALEAEWGVTAAAERIASGNSQDALGASWGGGETTKTIGSFAAQAGRDYTVIVRFTKPLTVFSKVNPLISISGDRQAFKTWYVNRELKQTTVALVLLIGFAWFFVVRVRSAQAAVIALLNEREASASPAP